MKKIFSVFVAGSTDLKQERDALRVVAQRLNTRYHDQNFDIFVELKTYEDGVFKNKQENYEAYIKEKADMVVFVLDGRIGEITTQELKAAVAANKEKKLPEIVVYLKEYEKETEEIRNIQRTLKDILDDYYYVCYKDENDLSNDVSARIRESVNSADHTRSMKKWRMISIFIAIAALLLMSGLTYFSINKLQKQTNAANFDRDKPMLLFLGGGSVANFIEKELLDCRVDYMDSLGLRNTMYLGVPTGNLWTIIGEQYYNECFKGKDKYYPVFLAASKIDMNKVKEAVLDENVDMSIKDKMLIFELNLGKDTVITYFANESVLKAGTHYDLVDGKLWQNKEQLKNTIDFAKNSKSNVRLFTTTKPSGTWNAYKEILKDLVDSVYISEIENDTVIRKIYNDRQDVGSGSFVLLGSGYYYPTMPSSRNMIYVSDSTKTSPKTKDLYLYFIAYAVEEKREEDKIYRIPEQVVAFLNILEDKLKNNKREINYINKIKWDKKTGDVRIKQDKRGTLIDPELPKDGIVSLSLKRL